MLVTTASVRTAVAAAPVPPPPPVNTTVGADVYAEPPALTVKLAIVLGARTDVAVALIPRTAVAAASVPPPPENPTVGVLV